MPAGEVSYADLNGAANRAARMLVAAVGTESRPIAMLLEQGLAAVVWTLAILKAGHCFAPLDQRLPEPVLRAMLEHLGPAALVAGARHRDLGDRLAAGRIVVFDADAPSDRSDRRFESENPDRPVDPDNIACIFYTSGSTGPPKGVADSHRNVLHNVFRYTNSLKFSPADTLSLVQNPSFSGAVSSLFGALTNGAAVAPLDLRGEGLATISRWLERAGVTVFHAVPSIFRLLSDPVRKFSGVRLVRLEGDACSVADIRHFQTSFHEGCTLVNGLGATECGLVRQFFVDMGTRFDAADAVPIGYPVPGVAALIADAAGDPAPAGAIGEIVVESRFLAQGYWRNPELTARRFEALSDGRRRYRTGDLGWMGDDGCLVHLGRVDHAIRVAGEFVATASLERLLQDVPGVAQAVIRDFVDRSGERRTCAYVVADRAAGVTVDRLRAALSERGVPRLLPLTFVFVDALPLTKDLKIDRGRLPDPGRQRPALPNDFLAPRSDFERQMAEIWSAVLEIDSVGVTDSFFDLGGDSLRAAEVVRRIGETQGGAMTVASLFEHTTISSLADAIERGDPAASATGRRGVDGRAPGHSIAVIGMAGRFPGAETLDEFWNNLRSGRESITFFRHDELSPGSPVGTGPGTIAARGVLPGADTFDAAPFRLTPRQAQMLDPQQRLWLECVHAALEDAGLPVGEHQRVGDARHIGVFAGARESTYLWGLVGGNRDAIDALLHETSDEARALLLGNDREFIASRTSFLLGFTGPSVNVQTACSTSLVAIAQACDALVSRQCEVAIAGGVAVTFPQNRSYRFVQGGIHSHDGHCRAFDASATGTVFGDGVGAVVLKRLDDAMADGDRIDAVILGWAVNNDGSNKASFSAPSVEGQARVIALALDHANVEPGEVGYVEAHGTGTPVGDPIEFAALTRVFRRDTTATGACGLGSVKSNIGHLDTAAGVAGLIKTVLALKHREIPPTLHFRQPNPQIELAGSPFRIADALRPWPAADGKRIAGVSSLGVGGTNCHVVLRDAVPGVQIVEADQSAACIVTLSAASAPALEALEARFRDFLSGSRVPDLESVAATTQRSRSHYPHRLAVIGNTVKEVSDRLSAAHVPGATTRRWRGKADPSGELAIGFLFAGQGSQYVDMGRALYRTNTEYRRLLQRCDRALRGHLDRPLLDVMFGGDGDPTAIQRTEYAQPALFALQVSLAGLLRTWGIVPRFAMGHSVGEYAAACVAGVFGLEEGIALTAERGRLMQRLPGNGRMLAVTGRHAALEELLVPFAAEVSLAAINSPLQCVVSGEADAIDRLKTVLRAHAMHVRELAVSHAFHSAQMDPMLVPLAAAFAKVDLKSPALRLIGNVHGRAVTAEVTDPNYWRAHARQPVQFAAGIRAMIEGACKVLVEIGPDRTLAHLVPDNDPARLTDAFSLLRRGEDDWNGMLEAISRLYVRGARIDWAAFPTRKLRRPVRLPTYPFDRSRHWYDGALSGARAAARTAPADSAGHPLLGRRLHLPGATEIRFETRFSQSTPQFLGDHRLFGISIPPGASHFAMLAEAGPRIGDGAPDAGTARHFESLCLLRPMLLGDGERRDVQLIFRLDAVGWSLELVSAEADDSRGNQAPWIQHMIGRCRPGARAVREGSARRLDPAVVKARCPKQTSGADFYSRIWANQGGTGSAFRWIESIWQGDREALCRAACPPDIADPSAYRLHPGLIEAACQLVHCCAVVETREALEEEGATFVPFSVDAFYLSEVASTHDDAWCHARLRDHAAGQVIADLTVMTSSGEVVATLEGFCLRQITRAALGRRVVPAAAGLSRPIPRATPPPANAPRPASSVLEPDFVVGYLRRQYAALSGCPETEIGAATSFIALGLDSIAAVILSNDMLRDLGCAATIGQILTSSGIDQLAADVCGSGRD